MDTNEIHKELFELKILLNDLFNVVLGDLPSRSNGLKGNLKELTKKVDDTIDWANTIWNVKRREECLGLAECIKVEKRIESKLDKEEINMTAKLNLKGVYALGILQFVGMIIVALIAAGAFRK